MEHVAHQPIKVELVSTPRYVFKAERSTHKAWGQVYHIQHNASLQRRMLLDFTVGARKKKYHVCQHKFIVIPVPFSTTIYTATLYLNKNW
jgi:hypothetical protein